MDEESFFDEHKSSEFAFIVRDAELFLVWIVLDIGMSPRNRNIL